MEATYGEVSLAGLDVMEETEKAREILGQAVEAGDVRAALVILKGCGLLSGQLPSPRSDWAGHNCRWDSCSR